MAGRAKRNTPDDAAADAGNNCDVTDPAIPEALLAALLTALAGTITPAVSIEVSAMRLVSTPSYSTAIDLFDTKSMYFTSRGRRGQWYKATEKTGGWREISLVAENANIFTNILTDRTTQFGLDPNMNFSTSVTGAVNVSPITISGEEIWSDEITDPINILLQTHLLSLEQVQAFSEWFMGDEKSTLATSTDMIIKAIDPKKNGQCRLV